MMLLEIDEYVEPEAYAVVRWVIPGPDGNMMRKRFGSFETREQAEEYVKSVVYNMQCIIADGDNVIAVKDPFKKGDFRPCIVFGANGSLYQPLAKLPEAEAMAYMDKLEVYVRKCLEDL